MQWTKAAILKPRLEIFSMMCSVFNKTKRKIIVFYSRKKVVPFQCVEKVEKLKLTKNGMIFFIYTDR